MTDTSKSRPTTLHATASDLAHALRDYARPEIHEKISLVPYNRFRPENSPWWICPGSDDPAYHYGKYIAKTVESDENLFAGICFEKGVGSTAVDIFKTTRLGMTWIVRPDWIWNPFFDSLLDGSFDRYAVKAQRAAGKPVDVLVSAGMMSLPATGKKEDVDGEIALKRSSQRIHYSFDETHLSLISDHSESDTLIPTTSNCHSLSELAAKIRGIKQLDWVWVNVEFGFLLSTEGTSAPKWHTETIWTNACEPFLDWFR